MRLGIGSYTYGWASGAYSYPGLALTGGGQLMSAEELIDRTVSLGLHLVQLSIMPQLHTFSEQRLMALRDYAQARSVEIEVGTTGSDPKNLLDYLRLSELLGAKTVRTIFPEASQDLGRELEAIRRVVEPYEKSGVSLMVENHEAYSTSALAELLVAVDSRLIGACIDPVNSLGNGEGVEEVVANLGRYVIGLHVKDFDSHRHPSNQEFTISGAPAGSGRLDIPRLIQATTAHNPDISIVLEQWTSIGEGYREAVSTQEEWAKEGIAYIKEFVQ